MKRYIIEFGMGADLHGQDATNAAVKAVKDAMSHCCLCGVREIFNLQDFGSSIKICVRVACPDAQSIDKQALWGIIPFERVEIETVAGGLVADGLSVPTFGEGSNILLAVAAITVWIDM